MRPYKRDKMKLVGKKIRLSNVDSPSSARDLKIEKSAPRSEEDTE